MPVTVPAVRSADAVGPGHSGERDGAGRALADPGGGPGTAQPVKEWRRLRLDRVMRSPEPDRSWLRRNRRWNYGQVVVSAAVVVVGLYYVVSGVRG
jgi:hypothetical protein